jgi:D-tyrosyl-tRNA(Tyr) deacylase
MRALIQRVSEGGVVVDSENYSAGIGKGIVILLGVKEGDTEEDAKFVADKCSKLRIFEDDEGKMNISVNDVNGEALVISQFTLYGNTNKGNRPSFVEAANPELAEKLYEDFVKRMKENVGDDKVKTGIFGAMMNVKIYNDGPVTVIVESKE